MNKHFHVRPAFKLNNSWVVDGYDGRGRWLYTYNGSAKEGWTKRQAQAQARKLRAREA